MALFRFNTVSRSDIERSKGGRAMIQAIDTEGTNNQMVVGVPGSGKTTVTIMRAQRLANQRKRILLFTYQNLLHTSLVNMAERNLKPHIFGFFSWYSHKFGYLHSSTTADEMIAKMTAEPMYDEILIDEGQDIEERIYHALLKKCHRMTVAADNAQKIHEKGMLADQIEDILQSDEEPVMVRLEYNYRNTFEIYNFARYFMPDSERANNPITIHKTTRGKGTMPVVMQVNTNQDTLNRIRVILENNTGRNCVVLLYHKEEVNDYYNKIKEMKFACTKHHSGHHAGSQIESILITTYKSAKGLEFQVVIMPDMQMALATPQQTREHYYIGCTRTQESLYLLYQGSALPYCLADFPTDTYELIRQDGSQKNGLSDDLPF